MYEIDASLKPSASAAPSGTASAVDSVVDTESKGLELEVDDDALVSAAETVPQVVGASATAISVMDSAANPVAAPPPLPPPSE